MDKTLDRALETYAKESPYWPFPEQVAPETTATQAADLPELAREVSGRIDELMVIMREEILPRNIARLRRCNCKGHCKAAADKWTKILNGNLSSAELLAEVSANQKWLDATPPEEYEEV